MITEEIEKRFNAYGEKLFDIVRIKFKEAADLVADENNMFDNEDVNINVAMMSSLFINLATYVMNEQIKTIPQDVQEMIIQLSKIKNENQTNPWKN